MKSKLWTLVGALFAIGLVLILLGFEIGGWIGIVIGGVGVALCSGAVGSGIGEVVGGSLFGWFIGWVVGGIVGIVVGGVIGGFAGMFLGMVIGMFGGVVTAFSVRVWNERRNIDQNEKDRLSENH